ncbi:hypothetical protein E4T44_00601 [Aureobasidium sp. EXF-8845]|nr:hypothetical protein E4T44_00601 [Aureobasidium sp. EXF-8845]KAI4857902.1 hypothetical protein E4T45_00589 [Aureobasidium sp. EXF-8846]
MSPELKMPKPVRWDTTYHPSRSTNVDRFKDEDVGLLVGGIKPIVTQEPKSTHQERTITTVQGTFVDRQYPIIADPVDPCRALSRGDLMKQRAALSASIGLVNAAMLFFALFAPRAFAGRWVLSFILFVKAKDCVSAVIGMLYVIYSSVRNRVNPPPSVESKWILCLIPAFSEEEEMIRNCVFSLRNNGAEPHKQLQEDYVTSRFKRNEVEITAGFMEDVPVICFEKTKNAGKKDSLILCHDLFKVMRDDAPFYTRLLREEIEKEVVPTLVGKGFPGFDMIFLHRRRFVAGLANAIARDPKAITARGLILVDLEPGAEWSSWNLYQQFQFVRRQAEGAWGKVICLPGCITMIAVRPEMAGAMRKYAAPVTAYPAPDISLLSQSKDLHTLFVPTAVSETVAPQSLKHYLSQRRRWGSNAYFNNYFYFAGENMILVTRL